MALVSVILFDRGCDSIVNAVVKTHYTDLEKKTAIAVCRTTAEFSFRNNKPSEIAEDLKKVILGMAEEDLSFKAILGEEVTLYDKAEDKPIGHLAIE